MERTLPALRFIAVTLTALVYAALTARLAFLYSDWWGRAESATDWGQLTNLNPADPYALGIFRWSPPAAWLWVYAVEPMGPLLWRVLHVVALAVLRRPLVIAFVALSFPFWQDVKNGNIVTFVMVAAWAALAGSRWGTYAFLALAALVPRPLMLPVLAYLLWTRPWTRLPFAAMVGGVLSTSLIAGQLLPFIERLRGTGADELMGRFDWGPSLLLGSAWLILGPILAIVFLWRRRFGLASLAAAPYWLQYYYLMLALELRPPDPRSALRPLPCASSLVPRVQLWRGSRWTVRSRMASVPPPGLDAADGGRRGTD